MTAPHQGNPGTGYIPPDMTEIDASNPEALKYWARTLEVPEDKIRRAVEKVGPILQTVKEELGIGGGE
ncbi:MAG TPA: DUF3606 domain-containing protein [Burkholderiales bacterium]|nr:DUF3606 domain-containing protein [Burkholderiales bacterium]